MTSQAPPSDKKQIGLALGGSRALARLMAEGLFAIEGDAYKFGIAYAIATGLSPDDAPDSGYATKFNATGGLDREGLIRDLLAVLRVGDIARPYATAERLAEVGLTALAKRVEAHESLADILRELATIRDQADGTINASADARKSEPPSSAAQNPIR
jgi:hypothetical protein